MEFQRQIGRKVFEFNETGIKTYIIRHDLPFKKNYLYIPHGPVVNFNAMTAGIRDSFNNFLTYLKDLGKKEKSIFIRIEPEFDNVAEALFSVKGFKFKKSKKGIEPRLTTVIDLTQSEEELLARMHHKTRYNIRLSQKHEINVMESDNIKEFWRLLKKTSKRDKFYPHPFGYYEKLLNFFKDEKSIKKKLLLASYKDKPIAGAIVLFFGDTIYYLHGASDYKYRQFMGPYLLHWAIIKMAKNLNLKNYDMWGIDARRWPGVTRFKLGFGGRTIEYPGSFDLPLSQVWYILYKIARRILR